MCWFCSISDLSVSWLSWSLFSIDSENSFCWLWNDAIVSSSSCLCFCSDSFSLCSWANSICRRRCWMMLFAGFCCWRWRFVLGFPSMFSVGKGIVAHHQSGTPPLVSSMGCLLELGAKRLLVLPSDLVSQHSHPWLLHRVESETSWDKQTL